MRALSILLPTFVPCKSPERTKVEGGGISDPSEITKCTTVISYFWPIGLFNRCYNLHQHQRYCIKLKNEVMLSNSLPRLAATTRNGCRNTFRSQKRLIQVPRVAVRKEGELGPGGR